MATPRICSIPDCGKKHYGRGWCHGHYQRWWMHGDPLAGGTASGAALRYLQEVVLNYDGDECLPWPFARTKGYGRVDDQVVSRLVCEAEHGPPPTPKHEAAHSCGKGHLRCCTKRHISWKTHAENMADMLLHGTVLRGERHYKAKLTNAQAREIRSLRGIVPQAELGARYGIATSTVCQLQRGKTYRVLD